MDLRERTTSPGRRHPWETARAAFLLDALDGIVTADAPVLDVGAGDAFFASRLRARTRAPVTCWDEHYSDDDLARVAALGLTATKTAPAGTFAVALLLDVIEHVDDDEGLVRAAAARVVAGGHVLVSVPCWPWLFSEHDRALGHRRRYTPASCRAVLRRAGLDLERSGGFFHGLLLPRAASVVVEQLRRAEDAPDPAARGVGGWSGGVATTALVHAALLLEQRLSRVAAARDVDVPGLSFFALCRTPRARSGEDGP